MSPYRSYVATSLEHEASAVLYLIIAAACLALALRLLRHVLLPLGALIQVAAAVAAAGLAVGAALLLVLAALTGGLR